ncbi:sunset domain-containing protein [Marmoricola endophyticus]
MGGLPAPPAEGPVQSDEWPGSVRPLPDGSEPEGHPVKGNKVSGLFHEPGGRWYAQTRAEVWFDSADSAEAAGFTRAGSRSGTTTKED